MVGPRWRNMLRDLSGKRTRTILAVLVSLPPTLSVTRLAVRDALIYE